MSAISVFFAGFIFALHLGQRESSGLSSSFKLNLFDRFASRSASFLPWTRKTSMCRLVACWHSSTSLVRRTRFSVFAILMSVLSSRLLAYFTLWPSMRSQRVSFPSMPSVTNFKRLHVLNATISCFLHKTLL